MPPFEVLFTHFLRIIIANGSSSVASQQKCTPWQLSTQFFKFLSFGVIELQAMAVLWPLFGLIRMLHVQEPQTMVVYGHFLKLRKTGHKTANYGSSMSTFQSLKK